MADTPGASSAISRERDTNVSVSGPALRVAMTMSWRARMAFSRSTGGAMDMVRPDVAAARQRKGEGRDAVSAAQRGIVVCRGVARSGSSDRYPMGFGESRQLRPQGFEAARPVQLLSDHGAGFPHVEFQQHRLDRADRGG